MLSYGCHVVGPMVADIHVTWFEFPDGDKPIVSELVHFRLVDISLPTVRLSVHPYVPLAVYVRPSVCLSICLSLSVCLSVRPPVCLSVCLYVHYTIQPNTEDEL